MIKLWPAAALLLLAAEAHAFVCGRVPGTSGESGPSLSWSSREISYALHADGTSDLPGLEEHTILAASFTVWENLTSCAAPSGHSDVHFVRGPDSTEDTLVGFNHLDPHSNENLVVFRDEAWPLRGENRDAVALTTTTFKTLTGEIYDADIEFNSADNEFVNADDGCAAGQMDLMNTAVHEIGHVLGLGHPDKPEDYFANPYDIVDPGCATGATMCFTAASCETRKRDLDCDDRNAVVFKYPEAQENGFCSPPACAAGLPACGGCTEEECTSWLACGFCAPPDTMQREPIVTAIGFDTGTGCSCSAPAAPALWLLWLWFWLWLPRRRR